MVLGTMVCPSFVLGGDANTGSAGYVCFETELENGESDFDAVMPAAFASAAFLGQALAFRSGLPCCTRCAFRVFLCFAALSGFLRRLRVLAAMLFLAALSDGYGGYACCVEYSLEFLVGSATLIAPFAAENTQLFILTVMVQVALCAEKEVEEDFF